MNQVPEGLGPMLEFRKAGKLPSNKVVIKIGDQWQRPNWYQWIETVQFPDGVIRDKVSLNDLDLRVIAGLFLSLHCTGFTKRVADIFEMAKEYADHIVLSIESVGGDIELIEWRKP